MICLRTNCALLVGKKGKPETNKPAFNKFVSKLSLLIYSFLIQEKASSMIIQQSTKPGGLLHFCNEMLWQTMKEQFSEMQGEGERDWQKNYLGVELNYFLICGSTQCRAIVQTADHAPKIAKFESHSWPINHFLSSLTPALPDSL